LLAQLGDELETFEPHMRDVTLRAGQVLNEPGQAVRDVFFLQSGIVSHLVVFADGTEIECALVGREGAVGVFSALGLRDAFTRDVCHLQTQARCLSSLRLQEAIAHSETIHEVFDRYCACKASNAVRNGACNAVHPIEQRLCRWLLTCSDILEQTDIALPQDVFANMLGVQRTSVNPILQRLQGDGLVELGRSRVTLLNRDRLMARTCECYAAMKRIEAQNCGTAAALHLRSSSRNLPHAPA
jgi:CRP-like cAMP-binding protein